MANSLWVFPALFCLLLSMTFTESFFLLGLIFCIVWFIRVIMLKQKTILNITLIIGCLFLGGLFAHKQSNETILEDTETTLIVYPDFTSIKVDGDSIRFDASVNNKYRDEKIVVRYYAKSATEKEQWLENPPENQLILEGNLELPAESANFYQFDYQKYLKRQGIYWQFNAETISIVESQMHNRSLRDIFNRLRFRLLQNIDQLFNPKVASYIKSLFFADRRGISEEILFNYRSLGVIHFFSISGFHINFLIRFLKYLLLRVGISHERTNIMLVLMIPLYGTIAGWGISIFRASTQAIFRILGQLTNKPMDSMDAWALTLLLALYINPFQIYHIAFQLSYTLSGLLIILNQSEWIRTLNSVYATLLFACLASIASIPILSYHFFEISWVSILANLLFLLFFTYFLFPALVILLVIAPLLAGSRLFLFLNHVVSFFIQTLEHTLDKLNQAFDFSFVIGRLPAVIMILLVLCIYYMIRALERKKHPAVFSVIGFMLCLNYYQISPVGYVMMLDVDQGDSILIKDPLTRKISLIDTGGRSNWWTKEDWQQRQTEFSIGQDIVVPALKAVGVSTLDYLYITHADIDHSGEIASIGQKITIKEIITTEKTFKHENIYNQIKQLDSPLLTLANPPEAVAAPMAKTAILHPQVEYSDSNNHSLVMYGKIGDDYWLFTGDIEATAEQELIKAYPQLQTDYLKVSHHGSDSSTTESFVKHIQPQTALISAGKNNSFGHPHPHVLSRLKVEDVQILQTNEVGAIRVRYLKLPIINNWYKIQDTVHTD